MARHKVEITGLDTSKIKVLKHKEMLELFAKLASGDRSVRNILAEGNLKLVLSILRNYSGRCDNMDDLFQIGCVGLLKAIDNFDLKHGVRFSTYGVPMIQGEVRRYLRDNNSIRVSRSLKDTAYKVFKAKEELTNKDNIEPSMEDISKYLDIPVFDILNALEAMHDPISIHEPIYNDGGDTIYLLDQIEDKKDKGINLDMHISIDNAIDRIKEREKYILNERFIIGKTQMEIAEEIGISQAQVSRLEKSAINNVKKLIK